jgi:unsaturated rhamnogalacturonyl hydrolase
MRVSSASMLAAVLSLMISGASVAQTGSSQSGAVAKAAHAPGSVERDNVGDEPDDPGPLATDLSPKLTHKDIHAAMKKVADWQLRVAEPHFNRQWTYAPLYDGFLAASKTLHDPAYHDAVVHFAEQQQWTLADDRFPHADDFAFGQPLMDLYFENKDPQRMASVKANADRLLAWPDKSEKDVWWWCDALFMAPQVLARVSRRRVIASI